MLDRELMAVKTLYIFTFERFLDMLYTPNLYLSTCIISHELNRKRPQFNVFAIRVVCNGCMGPKGYMQVQRLMKINE